MSASASPRSPIGGIEGEGKPTPSRADGSKRQAVAHSWYPTKCCGGHDCRKVDSIEKLDDGDLRFRAGSISVVVPAEFMRLPSPDNDTHVCVYRVGSGEYRPRCVFVPGLI